MIQSADQDIEIDAEELGPGKIPFRRFFYRGYEVEKLLDLTHAELMKLFHARARRHFARGSTSKSGAKLLKRLRKAKKEAGVEKPETIKTHMRNQIILPEMVASIVGVYNGLNFTQVRTTHSKQQFCERTETTWHGQ